MSDILVEDIHEGVKRLTLNRPEQLNSFTFAMYSELIELLKKLVNRHGKIVSRRKSGCTAVSQHAVALAIKRARHMALLPYVGE